MNRKAYYGEFGGQYVAESLMNTLEELDAAFEEAIRDPEFLKQYHYYLKQYVGRLIRSEYDTGVVAILDSRVNSTGKYRNIVLESLFDAEVTNNITSVERFIMEKKKPDYFE